MATGRAYDPDFSQSEPPAPPQSQLLSGDAPSSLEDLLRNGSSTYGRVSETNGLAPVASRTLGDNLNLEESVNIDAEDDNGSQPTQDRTSRPPTPIDPSTVPLPVSRPPSNISLPVSRPPSTQRPRQGDRMVDSAHVAPHAIEEMRPQPYRKTIKNAGKVLEHIKNGSVGKPSRHAKTSITYYDYRDDLISDPTHIDDSATIAALCHVPEYVQQRLIFVEDLSKPMIDMLGENFSINPEFFEEHLLNSGYVDGKYDSPPARNWSTASFEKSYISFRWIRPIYRRPTYFSSADLEDLLEDSVTHFTRGRSVTTEILTNIFRLDWGLWTDPTTTSMMKRVCGLEERVSIWRKKLINQNTEIVIVLLDPLPEISETNYSWTSAGSQRENDESKDKKKKEKRKNDDDDDTSDRPSNELSEHWTSTGSRGENGENDGDDDAPHHSSMEWSQYRTSTGSQGGNSENDSDDAPHYSTEWSQYRASTGSQGGNSENDSDDAPHYSSTEWSQYRESTGSQGENGENNSDDDDVSHYSSTEQRMYIEELIMDEEQPQRVRDESSFARSLGWILGREKRRNFRPGKKVEVLNVIVEKKKPKVLNKVIIEQIAPRQAVSADLDSVFQILQSMADLQEKLQETKSTKSEICDALGMHQGPVSLLRPLVRIIQQDTMTLLNQLRQILDEIDIEILNDIKMEERLSLWRQIINRAQRELPDLRYSMEPFIEFLIKLHPLTSSLEVAAMGLEATQDMHELWKSIDHIIVRLQRTSASLASNMGLLESRRSIDEAHAVARLTELAFVFVPMSFAASVFGMQIEPFANPVPISNFFAVAVGVTSFAYLMRMTMRSHWLTALKETVRQDVRKYAARNGQPVQPRALPMLLVFRSIASRLSTIIAGICKWVVRRTRLIAEKIWGTFGFIISFFLLNGVASAIPIGVLWTRELESNVRVSVSIAIIFIVIATVGVPFWVRSKPKFRNALPKLVMERVRRAPWQVRMAFIYLILTTTFIVVPLALIWTRPLAIGIKSGLTVGIVMTVILIMLTFILLGTSGPYRSTRFHR
ncbi:Mg2+ transporter protein CorA-like/Zinc transport protein ZntB [Penicillium samsonianum]|uniref:Mg2+ transporter protein CorA-like/Zinc transport protein ZntB n=1 Tax=Penicillium samsonianum TaxID=1882272 RepID=UPI00254876C6|nr:Mg2+ transporter protein CorA-like/Zinc transport protein ZntB [Penicillium samsonianum]KAJ6125563.1 Mg2+ transporter protein CorA-like/Zinc transport protein ZntB [Penicillium samsonianum]